MIHGRYEPALPGSKSPPAPRLFAGIRPGRTGGFTSVDSLVDTGADLTTIGPADALRIWGATYLAWDNGADPSRAAMTGIGGELSVVERSVTLLLGEPPDDDEVLSARITLRIAAWPVPPLAMTLPSLLGRDVLQQLVLTMDITNDSLTFTLPS